MREVKLSLAIATVAVVGLALWANAYVERTAGMMSSAADRLLDSLDDGQRQKVQFAFDDPERLNWHFIPRERRGLPILEMQPEQQALAFGLLQSGLSPSGGLKATTIMSLEAILREMENDNGERRNPEKYYFSIFGKPGNTGEWGWRVEGHHLSVNITMKDGAIASATPAFFGANPAEVRQGPRGAPHPCRPRGPRLATGPGPRREPAKGGDRRDGGTDGPRKQHRRRSKVALWGAGRQAAVGRA